MGFTGDPVWLEDVLRESLGDRLVVEGDWVHRDSGGTMGDIWGVMIHHTGTINETVAHIRDGVQQPGGFLPGPLAQCLLTPDGKCHLIAVGPCNHAGDGFYPGLGSNNGNRRLIAFECCWPTPRRDLPPLLYDPNERWSTPLVITMRDATAAVLKKLGVGSARTIGHKEYAPHRKIDPANMSMDWFRGEVQKDLDGVVFPAELAPPVGPLAVVPPMLAPPVSSRTDHQLIGELCDQLPGPGGQLSAQLGGQEVADQLAEIARLATDLRGQLDDLRAMQLSPGPNGQSGDGAVKRAAATKKAAAKKEPAKRAAKKPPAKKIAVKTP